MVFYVPLSSAAATAETGQSLTYNGQTPTSAVISGIQCLQFNANNYITAPDTGLSFGSNNATISVWVYAPNTTSYWKGCLGYGTHTTKKCIRIALNSNQYDICGGFEFADIDSGVAATTGWHHALLVRDGDNAKLYVDGVLTATDVFEEINITSNGKIYIASQTNGNSAYLLNGYLAAARVYDRALTDDEITALAHEFDAKIPADYVFFMPMTSASDYDTNGADVEVVQNGNGATFSDVDGMHAASFASTSDYYVIQKTGGGWPANIPYGANPLAVSVWIKGNMTNNGDLGEVLSLGTTSYGMTYCFGVGYNGSNGLSVGTEMYGGGAYSHVTSGVLSMSGTFDTNWHHVYSCNWDDNGTSKGCVYIDGKFCYEGTSMTKNTSTAYAPQINGCRFFSGQNRLIRTSISALRLYNRVLTADEIALLASEFTPTVS